VETKDNARALFDLVRYARQGLEKRLEVASLKLLELSLMERPTKVKVIGYERTYHMVGVVEHQLTKQRKGFEIRLDLAMGECDREAVYLLANEIARSLIESYYPK